MGGGGGDVGLKKGVGVPGGGGGGGAVLQDGVHKPQLHKFRRENWATG